MSQAKLRERRNPLGKTCCNTSWKKCAPLPVGDGPRGLAMMHLRAARHLKIVRVDLMNNRLRMYKSRGKLVFG